MCFSNERIPDFKTNSDLAMTKSSGVNTLNHAMAGPATMGMTWAGEFHSNRKNFRRSRDHISQWTNVRFNNSCLVAHKGAIRQ